jgi:hypothetical protein
MAYTAPSFDGKAFNCPHCGAFAHQWWENFPNNPVQLSCCAHCEEFALWVSERMVYPDLTNASSPNDDLSEEVKKIYLEASSISARSPRSAAGLLRVAIQLLCKELGEDEKNLNQAIANLVEKGLPARIQQSLDIVRVIGNHAVHPGQIEVDSADVVSQLFVLVNLISEYMISMPKKVSGLYDGLPEGARGQIDRRDAST